MKILELELLSDDIEKTEQFYNEVLGLVTVSKTDTSVSFATANTKLTFRSSENLHPVYHFAFDIPNNRFMEAFAKIENKTEIMEVIPPEKIADFYRWNAKSFYFYDNNGNIVEFITRYDLKNDSAKPFDGTSVLSISEVGLVSPNVESQCQELEAKYGLQVYRKQPKAPKFIVIGTETGLFILVEENRNWYPTSDKKSKSFWTKIIFEHEDKTRELEVL